MQRYPILFGYRDLIQGDDYIASVAIKGRGLLVEGEEGFCMYGVNPGGMAGVGSDRGSALYDFRAGYRSVLVDLAGEAQSFKEFEALVRDFVAGTCDATLEDWESARAEVRTGKIQPDWAHTQKADEYEVEIAVQRIRKPQPSADQVDNATLVAA